MILVLQQKRLKSLNLNQTFDMARPYLPLLQYSRWCQHNVGYQGWALDLCPICLLWTDWIFFTLCVHMMFGTLTHVKGIWTLYLAGKQRSQVAISLTYLSWILAQLTLCWGCCELWGQLARVCMGLYLFFLFFKKKPHTGLDHRRGSVAMAPLWHTGVSLSSPGRAVAAEAKLPSVFSAWLRVCVRSCVCLSSPEQAHMRQCM